MPEARHPGFFGLRPRLAGRLTANSETGLAEAEAERVRIAGNPISPRTLGIHVDVGPSFREKMRNAQKAMVEGRTRLIDAILEKA
jgi:hypothetical protein